MIPPKPGARAGRVSLWRYARLFRDDLLSAQPDRLYRARMAEFRTPFFRSFLINVPDLVRQVLTERPAAFPKSGRVAAGLEPLLGRSVFVTNGAEWARQRRIIDPAFEGGRLRGSFPAILAAARAAVDRVSSGTLEAEAWASHATADAIFRTLFSLPIEDRFANETYAAFRAFQRAQPVLTARALVPWLPVILPRRARAAAKRLRGLIAGLVSARHEAIAAGTAPGDLATKIMTTTDPETGRGFTRDEMVDQVAIFFLAGHETSAALVSWALWLLAACPVWQDRAAAEAGIFATDPDFSRLSSLRITRDVLRETLRLYPPVPMMVRETTRPETFRDREVPRGAQVVISSWHLGRHERHWTDPDAFNPARWETEAGRAAARDAWLPFSAGPRACPGAGFAMAEAAAMLGIFLARWRVEAMDLPVPVAHLTVRSRDGIRLSVAAR